jgi:Escherichia/Staphylococcus phage prohead protease
MDHILVHFEIKASGEEDGTISGYGSVFGNVDSHGDTVAPGAFRQTIADAKSGVGQWPAMLLQHGSGEARDKMPIGIWTHMEEDRHGLRLTGKLANTKRGREAYALLKMTPRPALDGLSIGYRAKDYELHRGSGPNGAKRTLKAVDLVECSLVTFPADKFARVASVKARREEDEAVLMREWAMADFQMLRRLTNRS